jgi:hypothetical protein
MYAAVRIDNDILPDVWAFFGDDKRALIKQIEEAYISSRCLIKDVRKYEDGSYDEDIYEYGKDYEAAGVIDYRPSFEVQIEDCDEIVGRWRIVEVKGGCVV